MMVDHLEYHDVVQEVRGAVQPGRLRLQNNSIIFKNQKTGKVDQYQGGDVVKANWLMRARGYCLKFTLSNDTVHRFDGLKETEYDELSRFFKNNYDTDLEKVDLSLKGWNWGKAKFEADDLSFEINNKPAFDVPLTNVSNSVVGKNEVTLEFHINEDAAINLLEMRFHIPADSNPEKDRVNDFYNSVMDKADIIQATGDAFATFSEVSCLTPRGRYDIKIYPTFLQLHGKTFDYKIPYTTILRLFLLPHKDGRQTFFVVSVDPPMKQGQTRYPFLIMQFDKDGDLTLELALSEEEIKEKYEDKLQREMVGPEYEVVSRVMKAVVNRKITVPGSFVGNSGAQCISCSYKAATGYLYPLERGFMFVPKPPIHIRFDEVMCVNFARSAGSSRSFDFEVETKNGNTFTFVNVEKEEYGKLFDHVKNKKLNVKNIGVSRDKVSYKEDFDESDDEHDAYMHRMKEEGRHRHADDLDDESDSSDEDFDPDRDSASSVAEEYDSNISSSTEPSSSSSDSDENMDPEQKKKRKEMKEKARERKRKEKERRKKARIMEEGTRAERKEKKKTASAKKNTGKRKGKKGKDPNKPKRPQSAYFLWLNDNRESIKKDHPDAAITEISKFAGEMWREIDADTKKKYEAKAAEKKEEYQKAMEEYNANYKGDSDSSPPEKKKKKSKDGSPRKSAPATSAGSGANFKSQEFVSSSSSSEDEDDKPKKKTPKKGKPAPRDDGEDDDDDAGFEADTGSSSESEGSDSGKKKKKSSGVKTRRQKGARKSGSESEEAELPEEEEILGSPGSSAGPSPSSSSAED